MSHQRRLLSTVDGVQIVLVLGVLYVGFAVGWSLHLTTSGSPLWETASQYLLIAGLGAALVYGGYRVRRSDLDATLFPRVTIWTLGGLCLMLGVMVVFIQTAPTDIDRPIFSVMLAGGLGGVGGFGVGMSKARTLSRARKAEQIQAELEEAVDRLERQNERLEAFASIVSHDLRNPLNVAQGRLELARAESESSHLTDVSEAHKRMERLIDDLLTLAREGVSETDTGPVELAEVVDGVRQLTTAGDATVVVDTDCTIRADRSHLRQLLENLIENAVEHGGGDVQITVAELDDCSGFYVEDDGPGFPDDERERVLEAGYSTAKDGTGFGLLVVQEVAQAHGWEVGITEGDSGGARFEITGVDRVQ
jgi:signal transduction histidine kinase